MRPQWVRGEPVSFSIGSAREVLDLIKTKSPSFSLPKTVSGGPRIGGSALQIAGASVEMAMQKKWKCRFTGVARICCLGGGGSLLSAGRSNRCGRLRRSRCAVGEIVQSLLCLGLWILGGEDVVIFEEGDEISDLLLQLFAWLLAG